MIGFDQLYRVVLVLCALVFTISMMILFWSDNPDRYSVDSNPVRMIFTSITIAAIVWGLFKDHEGPKGEKR